jgi:hypothetical protein
VGCATNASRDQGASDPKATEGIEFELAVAQPDAFQKVLHSFFQFGLPITEASQGAGSVSTGPYRFNSEMIATYHATVLGSGPTTTRIRLRGSFTAPTLGVREEPIRAAEYGFRAKLWRHLSRLARAIETQPLSTVVPDEEIHRHPPN